MGAYLFLTDSDLQGNLLAGGKNLQACLSPLIRFVPLETSKSTYAELKTCLEALIEIQNRPVSYELVKLYSDCENLGYLLGKRRARLEKSRFLNKSGKPLQHADLYRKLFSASDDLAPIFCKIKGHSKQANRTTIEEQVFAVLDRVCRRKMRESLEIQEKAGLRIGCG